MHPVNRFCHSLGIPLIVVSLAFGVAAIFYHPLWMLAADSSFLAGYCSSLVMPLSTKNLSSSMTGVFCL